MIFNMVGGGAGGAGGGATLVVSSPVNVSVTVSKDDKSYTKNSGSLGSTTFKGLATGTWTVTISGNGQTATRTIEITADYAITIAFFSATINITYPANSNCVVTNSGGQTVASDTNTTSSSKTWTATVNATGTYTVTATATDGSGKSKSQNVEITADGQSESVKLNYDVDALLAYQWKALAAHGTSYSITPATIDNHVMTCSATYQDSSNQGNVRFGAQDKIDFTDIDTIVVVINSWNIGNPKYPGTIGLVDSYDSTEPTYLAKYDINSSITAAKEVSIDVSAITGEHYLIVHIRASYDPVVTITAKISKMILR